MHVSFQIGVLGFVCVCGGGIPSSGTAKLYGSYIFNFKNSVFKFKNFKI